MKQVKLPELHGDNCGEMLINFYDDIGFDMKNKNTFVNSNDITINEEDWRRMCGELMKDGDVGAGFMWTNQGPSGSTTCPIGQVMIEVSE